LQKGRTTVEDGDVIETQAIKGS